ncbi:class I adenylate-forming enzyme family protein [Streptomyces sp. NPDC052396]|uniref:class I adenylate-forming enzyme family protein n=1 Tax=Streptomyces sp. NPDC052396 TaxID=3365689 RepID=UPI0037D51CD7
MRHQFSEVAMLPVPGTLWELLDRRAGRSPGAPALIQAEDHRTLTFAGLRERALCTAGRLHRLGVRSGSRVVWQLPTGIETVVLCLALSRLDALQSPLIPHGRDQEAGHALRTTGAGFFVVPGVWRGFDHTAMAHRLAGGLTRPPKVITPGDLAGATPGKVPPEPADGSAVRWVHWTSGTTADPKGVLHTDRSLLAASAALAGALRPGPEDVGSIAFPFAHVGGVHYLVMLLLGGFPALLVEHFALPAALDAYRRHRVTIAGGSTAFYTMFLAEQRKAPGRPLLPALRMLAGGGAPRPPALHREVTEELGCALLHGYGMTEAPLITMGTPDDPPDRLATTEGRPPAGMEIRVTAADGTPLPAGTDGEIRLRGPAVCRGYADPHHRGRAFDRAGFLPTGDVGHLTPDGYLVLTGRLKDVIIRKGETISASEVERLLRTHPAVEDVAVIGLPDPARGERVCAVLQLRPQSAPLTVPEVADHLRGQGLAGYKVPEQVEVVAELPRGHTLRKVLKDELRARFSGGAGRQPSAR